MSHSQRHTLFTCKRFPTHVYYMSHSHVKDHSFMSITCLNTCCVNLLETHTWPERTMLCTEWMVSRNPWHTARENPTDSESVSPVFLFQFSALHIGVLFCLDLYLFVCRTFGFWNHSLGMFFCCYVATQLAPIISGTHTSGVCVYSWFYHRDPLPCATVKVSPFYVAT